MSDHTDLPFKAEYAKSGRSSCKQCKSCIDQDSLRLALMVQVIILIFVFIPTHQSYVCVWMRERSVAVHEPFAVPFRLFFYWALCIYTSGCVNLNFEWCTYFMTNVVVLYKCVLHVLHVFGFKVILSLILQFSFISPLKTFFFTSISVFFDIMYLGTKKAWCIEIIWWWNGLHQKDLYFVLHNFVSPLIMSLSTISLCMLRWRKSFLKQIFMSSLT